MFEAISGFISGNTMLLWSLFGLAMAAFTIYMATHNFWVRDFIVGLPVVGDLARLSKKTERGEDGWLVAEQKLCSIYKRFIALLPEGKFNERIEYMRNAGDLGRTPMPFSVKALLFVLVIAEGLGFSYILGTWMAREGSADTHTLLMFAIVFVIGVILVWITHAAGYQYYRTKLIKSCRKDYQAAMGEKYSSMSVALINDQSVDARESNYTRCLNRVVTDSRDEGSYAWLWVAGTAIAVIFILSTIMRWENLQGELTRETRQQSQISSTSSDPFAGIKLPDEVTVPQAEADKKLDAEEIDSTKNEGLAAILMLGFIFVVTQIVGFGAGYKYGFAGRETYKNSDGSNSLWFWSEKDGAYADTCGFSTYDSYWGCFEPMMDVVGARLRELQHRLQQNSHENIKLSKTFLNYIEEHQMKTSATRSNLNRAPVAVVPEKVTPEKAMADIEGLSSREDQMAYFNKLDDVMKNALTPWLKKRKEEADRKVRTEDLF